MEMPLYLHKLYKKQSQLCGFEKLTASEMFQRMFYSIRLGTYVCVPDQYRRYVYIEREKKKDL